MSARLKALWLARTPRERWLLGVMLALVALVLVWLLSFGRSATCCRRRGERHGEAVAALAEARSQAAAIAALERDRPAALAGPDRPRPSPPPRPRPASSSRRCSRKGRGGCRSPSARPSRRRCSAGSRALEAQGYIVERLTASSNPDRTLSAQIVLRARGG